MKEARCARSLNSKTLVLFCFVLFIVNHLVFVLQAARLGVPAEVWRLVDSVVEGGALQTAEGAAELFPPVEVSMPSDIPLDDDTAAVLR